MLTSEVLLLIVMALAARFMVPKMLNTESAAARFGIGIGLFGLYTAGCVLMFRYLCTVDGSAIAQLSGDAVWNRVVVAFLLMNLVVLFAACIFFFTRERRKLSQNNKMKLKDL